MGRDSLVPTWARRAVEAAAAGAILAAGSLFGAGLSPGGEAVALPGGVAGAVLLAPAVLALAVITTAYPVGLAATRGDALFGAAAAFLLAADVTVVVAGSAVSLEAMRATIPAGYLVAIGALGPAVAGVVAGQLAAPLGFGRRAGAWTTLASAIGSVLVLLAIGTLA